MTPRVFLTEIMLPSMAWANRVAQVPYTDASTRFLLAVAGQEGAWTHRAQVLSSGAAGPARSFWQFEEGGGVKGVLGHSASKAKALALCAAASVEPKQADVWRAIEGHDGLAYGFARLLLLTDPYAVPTEQQAAWDCYAKRLWRPGKPHPETWPSIWDQAGKSMTPR